jgi:hypothetical protein
LLKIIELRANSLCVEALYNSLVNIWWVPEGTRGKGKVVLREGIYVVGWKMDGVLREGINVGGGGGEKKCVNVERIKEKENSWFTSVIL